MESKDNYYITFGAQLGDPKADKAVGPHLMELCKLLYRFCDKIYCEEIDEIAPILRVDGELWYWEFEGCEKLRLSKKYRYITIDVGMPRSRWEGINGIDIRNYLIENLKLALELMVKRLKKEKYKVNENGIWTDFAKVEGEFLFN
ncbi:hypothetical protein [Paenisporosarcina sp. OV554]|uniref:hypothetical protein n=1 Tax=Paenisporosarcina sp. OV554 TaxID=2135694 RepID=UPI000D3B28C7|nr:hypothetical protein [Paenisporosarcina sp. OV554]PUB09977.1 hypothetical protein C8K15_1221 [Paenisporosarcina sp. OV554]